MTRRTCGLRVLLAATWLILSIERSNAQSTLLPDRVNASRNLAIRVDDEQVSFYLGSAPTLKNRLGLEGLVYRDGIEGAGYVRWRVLMRRLDGKPFDRNQPLRVVLRTSESISSPEVVHEFELKQGDIESHTSFLAPTYAQENVNYGGVQGRVRVYADGKELTGLASNQFYNYNRQNRKRPNAMALKVASRERLLEILDEDLSSAMRKDFESDSVWYLPTFAVAVDSRLPSDWRELSIAPAIIMEVGSFGNLSDAQKQGLAGYVACGGELIFAECDGLPDVPATVATWLQALTGRNEIALVGGVPWKNRVLPYSIDHGFGRISCIEGSLTSSDEAQVANVLPFERGARIDRLFDVDKMEWTIQKIGRPPVWMFLISIATFTLAAGPGLHWWVNRKLRRPIWLLVVFPALAAALTSGIFAYAIFHDGFQTHARVRSVTCCNASSGMGSVYARQTLFSGFPKANAEFRADSEVWEVISSHEERDFDPWNHEAKSSMAISPDALVCTGLLRPRDQSQWIVLRPVETFHPFDWIEDSEAPQVRNRLKDNWTVGIFSDKSRKLWKVEQAKAGQQYKVQPIESVVAKAMLAKMLPVDKHPDGYSDTPNQSLFDWMDFNRYRYWNATSSRSLAGVQYSMRYESRPNDWITNKLDQPRHFFLVLDQAEHVDKPLGKCLEEDSSHLVIGTW